MRHLMEPDPDAAPIDVAAGLWLVVAVLALVLVVAGAVR